MLFEDEIQPRNKIKLSTKKQRLMTGDESQLGVFKHLCVLNTLVLTNMLMIWNEILPTGTNSECWGQTAHGYVAELNTLSWRNTEWC